VFHCRAPRFIDFHSDENNSFAPDVQKSERAQSDQRSIGPWTKHARPVVAHEKRHEENEQYEEKEDLPVAPDEHGGVAMKNSRLAMVRETANFISTVV
jgi:hypothetical protein